MLKKVKNIKVQTTIVFLLFLSKQLINLNSQQFFYGDDSWLLLGARFDSLFDSLRCCAVSHPIFTIFAQSIFKIFNLSTESTIIFFLIYSNLLALLIFILPNKILNHKEKMITILLIISSPMFIHYGIRAKPYTTDVAITILTIYFFYKIQSSPKKIYFLILGFQLLISLASWPLIGALLLIYLFKNLQNKDFIPLLNLMYFIPGLVISAIQIFRWRDPGMQNFVVAYYAPTEGGPYLFFRWLGYSFIRFFGESNKLDLGFFQFSLSISILLFLIGVYYLFKNDLDFLLFASLGLAINLTASIFQIWPFGGFRSSIYLLPIFCIIFTKGISFFNLLIRKSQFEYFLIVPIVIYLFFNIQSPNYEQTTRPFDNEKFEKIINELDNSTDDFLIYHGGLQTVALYTSNQSYLENIGYFEIGSGTEGFHIPFFKNSNLHIGCTKYIGSDNGKECYEKNIKFLDSFNKNKIKLIGVHIRDHQLIPYIEAFQFTGWNMTSIHFLNEVAIIQYEK